MSSTFLRNCGNYFWRRGKSEKRGGIALDKGGMIEVEIVKREEMSMDAREFPAELPELLLPWYETNKRDLPWRQDRDPYHIWVSEIMLQQTRVEAVKGYYTRFLQALPTVEALARCDEDTLHKLWEGLGYYSRVRNLKKAAQVIAEQYGGVFPEDHDSILRLPGIGPYTAGAVCSIAFDMPTPAVDGNVLRVAARLWDDASPMDTPEMKARVTKALAAVYPKAAGTFTQALMELGATVCGPNRAPDCESCPCTGICLGFAHGTAAALPRKLPKREKRQEERTVFILQCDGSFALRRRPGKGLLAGLWEFPNVAGLLEPEAAMELLADWGLKPSGLEKSIGRKHIFTHIIWEMRGIYGDVREKTPEFVWMSPEEINAQAALPTAFRLFWEETEHV